MPPVRLNFNDRNNFLEVEFEDSTDDIDPDRLLPPYPAEGDRNDKIAKFDGNVLVWEPDAGGGGGDGGGGGSDVPNKPATPPVNTEYNLQILDDGRASWVRDLGLNEGQVDARVDLIADATVRAAVADWAEADNTDAIPASKLANAPAGGGGGLDEAAVDARIRAGVQDWAEADNTSPIPTNKLESEILTETEGDARYISGSGAAARANNVIKFDSSGNVTRSGRVDTENINDDAVTPAKLVDSINTDIAGKLNRTGGTMTGKITLDGDPTSNLHAATKQYVDNNAGSGGSNVPDLPSNPTSETEYNLRLQSDGSADWTEDDSITERAGDSRYVIPRTGFQ